MNQAQDPNTRSTGYWPILAWLALTVLSVAFYFARKYNLDFHTRDFQYYLFGFIHKSTPDFLTAKLVLNPEGMNALGFNGIDGFPFVWNDIHFSLITYPLAALYSIGGEAAIAFAYAGISAAAIVFITKYFADQNGVGQKSGFLLFFIIPLYLWFSTYDLRIYVFLISFALILFVAVEKEWSTKALVALLIVMFATREESYYFSLICAAHLCLHGRRKLALNIFFSALVYLALSYYYFFDIAKFPYIFSVESIGMAILPAVFFLVIYKTRTETIENFFHAKVNALAKKLHLAPDAPIVNYAVLNVYLAPIWFFMLRDYKDRKFTALFNPRYFILDVSIFLAAALIYRLTKSGWIKKAILVAAVFLFLGTAYPIIQHIEKYDMEKSRTVFQLSKELNRNDLIIVDMNFHQAFIEHNTIVWQRTPTLNHTDDGRLWPANKVRLKEYVSAAKAFVLDSAGVAAINELGMRKLDCTQLHSVFLCK